MLVDIIIIVIVAIAAYYLITTFFPAPIQTIALVVVGILLLLWLLKTVGLTDNRLLN